MVADLELYPFVGHLLNENLKFNTGTVLRVNKLTNGFVEFDRVFIEFDVEVSELFEKKFFPLSIFEEK